MILEKQYCQHLSLPSLLSSPSLSRFFPPSLAIINPISESVMVGDIFDDTQCWSRRAVSAAAAAQSYPNPLDNGANIVMESITPSSARFFFYTQCGIYRFDTFPGRPHSVLIGSETSITFQFYYRSLKNQQKKQLTIAYYLKNWVKICEKRDVLLTHRLLRSLWNRNEPVT